MTKSLAIGAIALAALILNASASAQIARKPTITAVGAAAAITACEAMATQRGWRMNIWIFDSSGNPLAFKRMDGAPYFGIESSRMKAWTSAQEIRPSGAYAGFPNQQIINRLQIFSGRGGYPVVIDGEIAGSVGVGGAGDEADEQCAIAGADAILRAAGAPEWRAPAPPGR